MTYQGTAPRGLTHPVRAAVSAPSRPAGVGLRLSECGVLSVRRPSPAILPRGLADHSIERSILPDQVRFNPGATRTQARIDARATFAGRAFHPRVTGARAAGRHVI